MKKVILIVVLGFIGSSVLAQDNMGVGTSTPEPSSVLDLNATDKGFLVPRMNTQQRTLIFQPATGLMVYDTDFNQFWYYDGAQWVQALGPQGPQGLQGPQGVAGPAGPAGADGADGAQGPAGADGIDGAIGPQGPAGINGVDGATGAQGPAGVDGAPGTTGAQGPAGADGAQGPAGLPGPAGVDGATGPQGLTGANGATGPQGPAGADGADGADGSTGPAGPQGIQGATGLQGLQGAVGADGPIGPAGPSGAQGPTGADGADGAQGPAGPAGPAGSDGPIGPQGPQGPQGVQGLPGPQGTAGADGAQGPAGPQGPAGADGAPGAQGAQGAQGPAGPQGAQGAQGPAGPVGCGSANYVVKSNGGSAVCSQIFDNGTNVGIGTTGPGYKLDLVGGQQRIRYDRFSQGGSGSHLITEIPWPGPSQYLPSIGFHWPTLYFSQFSMFNSGGIAAIDNAGTNGVPMYALNFNNWSDINIKKDVTELNEADYDNCLDDILRIRNIKYRFVNEEADLKLAQSSGKVYRKSKHIGVEAQSLPEGVYSELLNANTTSPDDESGIDFKGYGLADMDGLLIGGIKALNKKIENRNDELESLILQQGQLINQLKAEIEILKSQSK